MDQQIHAYYVMSPWTFVFSEGTLVVFGMMLSVVCLYNPNVRTDFNEFDLSLFWPYLVELYFHFCIYV